MLNQLKIRFTQSPDPEEMKILDEGLRNFNQTMGAPDDWIPLAFFVHDSTSRILGGLTGGTYWGWLYVGTLWLDEKIRGMGVGSRLLQEAETEAFNRGCKHAFLDTTSFQALPFYQKQGYVLYGQLDDFPPGHCRYFLKKDIS
jgi:GNAT superfamily N-acetyltransferase